MISALSANSAGKDRFDILLIEDNPGDARLVERRLSRSTYLLLDADVGVTHVRTLDEALDLLETRDFDAILLDLGLPKSQGEQTLKRMSHVVRRVPVIVLTGLDDPHTAAHAVRLGAQDYLHKDRLDGDDIARTLRYAIERHHVQRELQTRMTELDRANTMGLLAAGVAHEINNPMAYVVSNIEYALTLLKKGPAVDSLPEPMASNILEILDALHDALDGGIRVRDIVRDLRKLAGNESRTDHIALDSISIDRALTSAINIARKHIVDRACIVTEFEPVAEVLADETKLSQVLLNLLINAAQAIPEGNAEANEVRVRTYEVNSEVFIEVSDTGRGIAEQNLDRIFEPFFTTKPSRHGTGLGLSISKYIIEAFGGRTEVDSTPGQGSTFRIVLLNSEHLLEETTEVDED